MKLDLSSFENALHSLRLALQEYDKTRDTEINIFIRDACIQRFEYTYELSHKMLKRQLENMSANPGEIDQQSFADLIRLGNEQGLLLSNWEQWKTYRERRGTASHAYNEHKADQVFSAIPDFLNEAGYLFEQLKKHND